MKKRPDKLSFWDAMTSNGGFWALAFSLIIGAVVYVNLPLDLKWLTAPMSVLFFLATLLIYRDIVNERIAKGEFDEDVEA